MNVLHIFHVPNTLNFCYKRCPENCYFLGQDGLIILFSGFFHSDFDKKNFWVIIIFIMRVVI